MWRPRMARHAAATATAPGAATPLSIGGDGGRLSGSPDVGLANGRTGVNKPELLTKEFTTDIDVAGFLSPGQEIRLRQEIEDLEKDTGYKLRVLAQNYPDTPGKAYDWTKSP